MSKHKLQLCSPFLRGFLPGIMIGVFTSVLLFSLWRYPLAEPSNAVTHTDRSSEEENVEPREVENVETKAPTLPHKPSDAGTKRANLTGMASVSPRSYLVLVLIHSSAGEQARRDAVRATWLAEHRQQSKYVARFVVGVKGLAEQAVDQLIAESNEYGDMLLLPTVAEESGAEWASSHKLLQAFSWAVAHVNFTFLFKCNDGTYAILSKILDELGSQRSYLWGYFAGSVKTVRAAGTSKLVEEDWVLCSHYLPFPEGGGYIISRDLVELVVELGPDLQHYHHDDIALGVWLSPFKGIHKEHDVWFNSGYYSRGCRNDYTVMHRESAESMRSRHHLLQTKGVLCESEYQTRLSYRYNWTAMADRCCVRKVGIP